MQKITAQNISKKFNQRIIFSDINFEFSSGDIIGIFGANGSGKSTLIKIATGLLSPSSGSITLTYNGKKMERSDFSEYVSLSAPYLTLYDEFSAIELYEIICRISQIVMRKKEFSEWMDYFGLKKILNKPVYEYSTGMQQKLQLILAMINPQRLVFLDEPFANLDSNGCQLAINKIKSLQKEGYGFMIASNSPEDRQICSKIIEIGKYK